MKCEDEEEGDDGNGGQTGLSEPSTAPAGSSAHQRLLHGPRRGRTTGRIISHPQPVNSSNMCHAMIQVSLKPSIDVIVYYIILYDSI